MNVETLLEAAKFLELQEEQQRQREQQATVKLTQHVQQTNPVESQPPPNPVTALQIPTHQLQPQVAPVPTLIRTKQEPLPASAPRHINNSFDIINPLVIDDTGEPKRKQPPIPFRTGTREVHNKLEKDRRAHLKECFDALKKQLPRAQDERKSSNLSILHSALRYIQSLKKRERDLEHEMERLARQKIANQQRLAVLRKDCSSAAAAGGCVVALDVDAAVRSPTRDGGDAVEPAEKLPLPRMAPGGQTQTNGIKEGSQTVQATALSVVPVTYPVGQVVLQKVLVPKSLSELPLVSGQAATAVAHFISPQPLGGKVVPLMNAQYVVKPVVVVSTPSRPS